MLQELLPWLPQEGGKVALALAMGGMLVGVTLWLMGARFSRGLTTLIAVSIGGLIGMEAPRWYGLSIGPSAAIVSGAIVLGICGFVFHRLWVGIGLGFIIALWAVIGVWLVCGATKDWSQPTIEWQSTTLSEAANEYWQSVPEDVARLLPWTAGVALLSGIACAMLWGRLATTLLYSMTGVSFVVTMGLSVIQRGHEQWLNMMPTQLWAQLLTLGGLVMLGVAVQWRQVPGRLVKVVHHHHHDEEDDDD